MESSALRAMIRKAIRGSVLTGLAAGCGTSVTALDPNPPGSAGGAAQNPPTPGSTLDGPAQTSAGTGGMVMLGPDRAGGPAVITGGTGAAPGTGSAGMGLAGAGTGALPPGNCFTNPVGTCCHADVCFARESVDVDAGTVAPCPARWPQSSTCTYYSDLVSADEEHCCYIQTSGSCCGRPLLVGDRARGAHLRLRGDWAGAVLPIDSVIDPITRAALARAWLDDARLEHASIASFARFTLQALSLGAPAELIADAQRAALDEVAHAQACFALASRYSGQAIGPGEFPMQGVLAATTLAEAAAATVREGCVAETVAAVQAQAQLGLASDPGVRTALVRIAEDEARHAELAWRFVRWAIDAGGAPVRSAVAEAFERSLDQLRAEPLRPQGEVSTALWHRHGRLTPAEERSAWHATVRDVIEPCARDLIG